MTQKIALVGPESSGKSALASKLSIHLRAPLVGEFARHYLEVNGPVYQQQDLVEMARGQLEWEDLALKSKPEVLICDTNLLVIKVWSLYKYGRVDRALLNLTDLSQYAMHLLLLPDLPWEADAQRENPHDRDILLGMYQRELEAAGVTFRPIRGTGEDRLQNALSALSELGIA